MNTIAIIILAAIIFDYVLNDLGDNMSTEVFFHYFIYEPYSMTACIDKYTNLICQYEMIPGLSPHIPVCCLQICTILADNLPIPGCRIF